MAEDTPVIHQVVWTDPALDDLARLVRYIAEDNPAAAERVGGEIIAQVGRLAAFPFLGAVYRRDPRRKVREIPCRGYRIFYRVSEGVKLVEILCVWHGARDEPARLL